MKCNVVYTKKAYKDLNALPIKESKKILDKIGYFSRQKNPLLYAKKMQNLKFGTYRFRIGDFRALFDVGNNGDVKILLILTVKHRKDVYL